MDLYGLTMSSDLFLNPEFCGDDTWPCLRVLTINASRIAPRGKWYYTGDILGANKIDEAFDLWRTRPDHETFDPLVLSMSEALFRMPVLEYFRFEMADHMFGKSGVRLECWEADESNAVRRWRINTGPETEWDVPCEIINAWNQWVGEDGDIIYTRFNFGSYCMGIKEVVA